MEPKFYVFCYKGFAEDDKDLVHIYLCEEFSEAWHEWFQYLDWNRVALCIVARDDGSETLTEILRSDPSQTGESIIERGQRIREVWVTAHPDDYNHDSWETEIVLRTGEVIN